MSADAIRRIADAVLYEGYLLWPYRRSAAKNQQRWNFGCVMPPAWSAAHPDELSTVGTQVLVEATPDLVVDVTLRFLHVVHRQAYDSAGTAVDRLVSGDECHLSWDEATEREIAGPGPFAVHGGTTREVVAGGSIVRAWEAVHGSIRTTLDTVQPGIQRLTVRVANVTPFEAPAATDPGTTGQSRTRALHHALCSAHLVLHVRHGAFVSPLDAISREHCAQQKMWPVLVGEAPDRSTILASEIMLDEYPQVAPESPGDLFDGGEVDQLLTLNILGMTDEEKAEMRASDPRARAILERTEAMTANDLMRLHGTFRNRAPVAHT